MLIKEEKIQITEGPILSSMIKYAIPLVLASLIQVAFNMADQIVLSYMAGTEAVASVGACTQMCGLAVNLFCGLSAGVSVVLARYAGAGDVKNVRKTVNTTMVSSLVLGIIATAGSIPFVSAYLTVTKCTATCFAEAEIYLTIYLAAMPAMLVYNFGSTVLRVSGDSKTPLFYMVFAGLLNIGLNIILCLTLSHKVAAVAIATLASQVLGAILVTIHLLRIKNMFRFSLKEGLNFSWSVFGKILRYGLPGALNSCMYSISNMQIQSAINEYGDPAIAGVSAGATIESLIASFNTSYNTTMLTYVGQNLGAGNKQRVKKSIMSCLLIGIVSVSVVSLLIGIFKRPLLLAYLNGDAEAASYGAIRMTYIGNWYTIACINNCLAAIVQAFGYSWIVMLDGFVNIIMFRAMWMAVVYPVHHNFHWLMLCYTVSWILVMTTRTIIVGVLWRRYSKKGKVRRI